MTMTYDYLSCETFGDVMSILYWGSTGDPRYDHPYPRTRRPVLSFPSRCKVLEYLLGCFWYTQYVEWRLKGQRTCFSSEKERSNGKVEKGLPGYFRHYDEYCTPREKLGLHVCLQ